MAGATDGNAGGKIQEPIAVNVPDFDTATMRHHERVLARIRGRYHFGIAGQECPRFRSGQFGSDGGLAIEILVHAFTWLVETTGAEFCSSDVHHRRGQFAFAYAGHEGRAARPRSALE